MHIVRWVFCIIISFNALSSVHGGEKAQFSPNTKNKIEGLKWDDSEENRFPQLEITEEKSSNSHSYYYTEIRGQYLTKNSNLIYNNKNIPIDKYGNFVIRVPIEGEKQHFSLLEIGATGKVEAQIETLSFPGWFEFAKSRGKKEKKFHLLAGLGFTYIFYRQTGFADLSEILLTPKVVGEYQFHPDWDLSANAYFTVLPLFTSPSDAGIQFLGANLKLGYALVQVKHLWALKLGLGYTYATTISTSAGNGYINVQGPQVLLTFRREFAQGGFVNTYLKTTPFIGSIGQSSLFAFNQGEIAFGISYFHSIIKTLNPLGLSLDFALLNLPQSQSQAQSRSATLGFNYSI